jgi:hypothetical protein
MPYILPEQRDEFDPAIDALTRRLGQNAGPGVLNYVITRILQSQKPATYLNINTQVGILECVKLELYRRVAEPYEEIKRKQNGDVYHD